MFAVTIFVLLVSLTTDIVYGRVVYEVEIHRWMDNYNGPVNAIGYPYPVLNFNKGEELYKLVADGQYDNAVNLIKAMDTSLAYRSLTEVIQKLIDSHSTAKSKVMSFAYKLWTSGAKDVVQKYFPAVFKNILDQDYVKIVNKEYGQALKLAASVDSGGDRLAWGDIRDKTSNRVSWKFIPIWEKNEVLFKSYNIDQKMFLKLAVATDSAGDREAYGSIDSSTDRHKFYVEPHIENGDLSFFIINYNYDQGLKLIVAADSAGDRTLMSHNGDIYANNDRFKWTISPW